MKKVHPTTQYALDVLYSQYGDMCCELEKLACKRHIDDLEKVKQKKYPYAFDETRADRIFYWYQKICRHVRGPFAGEYITLEPFQLFDLGCIYGWVRKDTGARRFTIAFQLRARGNVKSTENSANCNFAMCADAIYPPGKPELAKYEDSPEVSCAAVDKLQAKRVWKDARAMGLASPDIMGRLNIQKNSIDHKTRGGFMLPLSKDSNNKDSGAETYISIDEYHAWPTSEIKDTLYSGFGKRGQSLMSIISTAGLNAENNPCRTEQRLCEQILKGELIDDSYFVMIRTLDKGDDPHDEATWYKANPIIRSDTEYSRGLLRQIKAEHDRAFSSGDHEKIRTWLTKRVNVWQDSAENKYFSNCMEEFKASAVSLEEFHNLTKDLEAYAGADLSKRIDLTADGYVIPLKDGRYAVTSHGYIPEDGAKRHSITDRIPYDMWAKDNWCTITPGAVTDYSYIVSRMHDLELDKNWKIKEFCYDPYQATQLSTQMEHDGYTSVEIRQGVKTLSEPTKLFRELVIQGKIVHDGNPLMIWCFSNAVEESDSNGNIKLSKKSKNDSQRIDLAAAIINAFVRAITHEFQKLDIFYSIDI